MPLFSSPFSLMLSLFFLRYAFSPCLLPAYDTISFRYADFFSPYCCCRFVDFSDAFAFAAFDFSRYATIRYFRRHFAFIILRRQMLFAFRRHFATTVIAVMIVTPLLMMPTLPLSSPFFFARLPTAFGRRFFAFAMPVCYGRFLRSIDAITL